MAGVYLSDLAQMGQDVAAQAAALESQATTLETQARAIQGTSPSSAQSMLTAATNLRTQAAKLRTQSASSGGVSSADVMNLFSKLTEAGSSVANTFLAKPAQVTNTTYTTSESMGLGTKIAIGAGVAALAGGVVWMATRQTAPVRANGRRKKRRNCGAGCGCPACDQ